MRKLKLILSLSSLYACCSGFNLELCGKRFFFFRSFCELYVNKFSKKVLVRFYPIGSVNYMSIPTTIADKLAYFTDFSAKITANPTRYGFGTDDATGLEGLVTAATVSKVARDSIEGERLAAVTSLDAALSAVENTVRELSNVARNDSDISDAALAELQVFRRSPPTPVPTPDVPPFVAVDRLTPGAAALMIRQVDSNGPRTRPDGAIGYDVLVVDGTVPVSAGETDSALKYFRSRFNCTIPTGALAKIRLRVYVRWVTARGLVSPLSVPIEFNPQT